MNFNKVILAGRLTRDPESRSLPSGSNVVSFGLATSRMWKDQSGNRQEASDFHNIVAFGKLADICAQYLVKGRLIIAEGRLQTRSWQDKDGSKKYRTEIVLENMQMGPRTDNAASAPRPNRSNAPSGTQNTAPDDIPVIDAEEPFADAEPAMPSEEKDKVDIDKIPF